MIAHITIETLILKIITISIVIIESATIENDDDEHITFNHNDCDKWKSNGNV